MKEIKAKYDNRGKKAEVGLIVTVWWDNFKCMYVCTAMETATRWELRHGKKGIIKTIENENVKIKFEE